MDTTLIRALLDAAGLPHATITTRGESTYAALGICEAWIKEEDSPEVIAQKIAKLKGYVGWLNAAALVPPGGPSE